MLRKSPIKRSPKPLKRTKLRRRSKSKATIDKADRALQDWYRTLRLSCEVCGKPAQLMHHFVPKSLSNHLRFEHDNLIPLCKSCHFRHHNAGDPTIHGTIIRRSDREWYDWIEKERKVHRPPYTKKELEEIIEKYRVECDGCGRRHWEINWKEAIDVRAEDLPEAEKQRQLAPIKKVVEALIEKYKI